MTLTEIRVSDKPMLTAADIAELLGSDPQTIRISAKQQPELVGFPYTFVGNRMKIPRTGFLNWWEGGVSSVRSDRADHSHNDGS